jgi:beta-glucanase (GH16 family)
MLNSISLAVSALLSGVLAFGMPTSAADQSLDISKYSLTFEEEFDTLDVSGRGPGTRWIAHTPWNGDFGDAIFVDPTPDFPFTVKNGMLRIEARKGSDGRWRSGLLASVDPNGAGFSQKFGYFEMRAKLPWGPGVWPAFWLIGLDRSEHTAEIDVMEHYGHAPDRFTSAVHVWNRQDPKGSRSVHQRTSIARGSLYDRFNTFGVSIDPEWIRMFLNRQEVWRTRTPDEHRQPMYILVDLGLGGGWPIEGAPNPSFMYVDYIRAYAPAP